MIKPTTFMKLAYTISEESKARRRKVGALIIKDNNVIAVGYNGTPSGFDNNCEDEKRELGYSSGDRPFVTPPILITKPEVLHAESNAIAKCARSVNSSDGADLYTTTSPCLECSKMIIQAGIKRVYYCEAYKDSSGIDLLRKAGIIVEQIQV